MQKKAQRWRSPFARWVAQYTVGRLTQELSRSGLPVSRHAVYGWVAGRYQPRPVVATRIVQISGGAIRLDDIYAGTDGTR